MQDLAHLMKETASSANRHGKKGVKRRGTNAGLSLQMQRILGGRKDSSSTTNNTNSLKPVKARHTMNDKDFRSLSSFRVRKKSRRRKVPKLEKKPSMRHGSE